MAIKEQIQKILTERTQKANILKEKREKINNLQTCLAVLGHFKDKAANISDKGIREQYINLFENINTLLVEEEIYLLLDKIDNAIRRFERDYISIATVGKARQGKSTFLQSVGNLGNDIIPAYDTGDCTGATSVIYNTPDMDAGTVSVRITFKQQQDLVTIVEAYIKKIYPEYMEKHSITFNMIKDIDLTELKANIPAGDATRSEALKHLTKIVKHYNGIRTLFGSPAITLTDPEKIKTYVAQSNGKPEGDPELVYYYNYLAVARADIYCKFYSDCGKIVLVDTVGLGDTQHGIDESMIHTVDKECDAAIVVTKPISGVHEDDLKLYNSLRDNFIKRDMSQWLFYVANQHKGNNDNAVGIFLKDIMNGEYSICDRRQVDCSNPEDVNSNFMSPLLEKLIHNMNNIDKAYLTELSEQEKAVLQKYESFLKKLPVITHINPNQEAGMQAFQVGQNTYKKMTALLKNQVLYWRKEKKRPNNALWIRVQHILNGMDSLVPNTEELQSIIDSNGAMTPNNLWEVSCNYVRNKITDRFSEIDEVMKKETINFKNSLVQHMYYALKNILPQGEDIKEETESVDMLCWLKDVIDHTLHKDENYQQIYKAFQFLYEFEFSIRENVIQEIRKQLYSINPMAEGYYAPTYNFNPMDTGEQVYYYLTSRLSVIEDELRHSLFRLYRMPNQTFYAAAEEFYDRLTFAVDLTEERQGEYKDMSQIWGNFFMQYSQKLWSDNAKRYEEVNALVTQYDGVKSALNDILETIYS